MRTPARYEDFVAKTCSIIDIDTSAVNSGDNGKLFAPLFSHVFTSYNNNNNNNNNNNK